MEIIDKILENIEIREKSGCWMWTGAIDAQGFGVIKVLDKIKRVTTISYNHFFGEIPEDQCICHTCKQNGNNPLCINPEHFYLTTKEEKKKFSRENKKEMNEKTRRMIINMYTGARYYNTTQISKESGVPPREVLRVIKKHNALENPEH